jgi:hypothetical protein
MRCTMDSENKRDDRPRRDTTSDYLALTYSLRQPVAGLHGDRGFLTGLWGVAPQSNNARAQRDITTEQGACRTPLSGHA